MRRRPGPTADIRDGNGPGRNKRDGRAVARGTFAGLIWGGIVGGLGVSVASLLVPMPPAPDAVIEAPGAGSEARVDAPDSGMADVGRDGDLVDLAPNAPEGAGSDASPLAGTDTSPGTQPQVGQATAGLSEPQAGSAAPAPASQGDGQVVTSGGAQAPVAGQAETAPVAETTPAAAPEPESDPDAGPSLPDPQSAATAEGQAMQQPDPQTSAPAPSADTAPSEQPESAGSISVDPTQPRAPDAGESGSGFGPDAQEVPPPGPAALTEIQPLPTEAGNADPETPRDERIAALPQAGVAVSDDASDDTAAPRPLIGTPVVPLTERNRVAEVAITQGEPVADFQGVPPLLDHAAEFDNPDDKPLMAIVLIEDDKALGAEALRDFPYPLTFALDPSLRDAPQRLARHRKGGFEVAVLADVVTGATAQDTEVSLSEYLRQLPETVALIEGVRGGIQGSRAISGQVTDIARATGRGLVTQSNGLNTVQKLAARDGVPSAVVFRDFDGAGQSQDRIRQFLDQAAFRARQEGAVVMLGRLRPDTISALLLWGLQDRAASVALAPLSAVLTREPDPAE